MFEVGLGLQPGSAILWDAWSCGFIDRWSEVEFPVSSFIPLAHQQHLLLCHRVLGATARCTEHRGTPSGSRRSSMAHCSTCHGRGCYLLNQQPFSHSSSLTEPWVSTQLKNYISQAPLEEGVINENWFQFLLLLSRMTLCDGWYFSNHFGPWGDLE